MELRKSIGQFDKNALKHQEVAEKNPLPSPDGELWCCQALVRQT